MAANNIRRREYQYLHEYYQSYPEDFHTLFNNSESASKKDIIHIPYAELVKLHKISDYIQAVYDEGVPPGETFELSRQILNLKADVFRWIPAVLEMYDVHVKNPHNLHYNASNSIQLPLVQNRVRAIIHMLGLPLVEGIIRPLPMPRASKPRRTHTHKSRRRTSKSPKNKATRRRETKKAAKHNITGVNSLEVKYSKY